MYTRISASVDDCPCDFFAMVPLIVKLQIFPNTCMFTVLVTVIMLVNSQAPLQKKEWLLILYSLVPHP